MYSQHASIKLRSVFGDNPGGGTTQLKKWSKEEVCPNREGVKHV